MNILKIAVLFGTLLKCAIASENDVAQDVVEAVEKEGFKGLKEDWRKWERRKDLFDYVVMKGVGFIIEFINQVGNAKLDTLAALFIKRSDVVDEVLKKIDYIDYELMYLTKCRPELVESHDNFFKVIDKIRDPENQEVAVQWGVTNLFKAEKQGSVIPLIDALEKRPFDGRRLKNPAIQQVFYEGVVSGIKDIVEEFHEHHAITPEKYANELIYTRNCNRPLAFQFLLTHADQGDLEEAKKRDKYNEDQEFRKAIDDAFPNAEPAGARHSRPKRRAEIAKKIFSETADVQSLAQEKGPGGIILGYLGGSEWTEG
jgi:hypothetical protein